MFEDLYSKINISEGLFQGNETKIKYNMRLTKCFNNQKTGLEKNLINVISNPLVSDSQRWLAMNFAGWIRPPLTRVGRTLPGIHKS
jgi:hypothetical protein